MALNVTAINYTCLALVRTGTAYSTGVVQTGLKNFNKNIKYGVLYFHVAL
jgi:hypothetical protein